jgi:transposase
VALQSKRIGNDGICIMSQITDICSQTITRGLKELDEYLASASINRVRLFSGRPRSEERGPTIEAILEQLLDNDAAGDPMSEQKWVRISTNQLTKRLKEAGHPLSNPTVSRLLKKLGFSLKVNKKGKITGSDRSKQDKQFQYIKLQRRVFSDVRLLIISIDTKKKELIGNFMNKGRTWCRKAEEVNTYDFSSIAVCRAVLYGVYDVTKNKGYVYVGTSADTPEFAVDAIARWWAYEGRTAYPGVYQLLILADGGGSNGCRVRAWKEQIQVKLCDKLGLIVSVCHYPPGCSKWNPVERRLFSFISMNWAGNPLRSLDVMLGYIRGTSTKTGLEVKAFLQEGIYKEGQKVTRAEMERLNIQHHTVHPDWNYTISPPLK